MPSQSRSALSMEASQVLGDGLQLCQRPLATQRAFRLIEAVLDVVVDQLPLGFGNRAFDRVELLRQVEAASAFLEHSDNRAKVTFGALQASNDGRVAGVRHGSILSSPIG